MTAFTYGFVCSECPFGADSLETAIVHVTDSGHRVDEYSNGAYHPAISRQINGSTTQTRYSPPGKPFTSDQDATNQWRHVQR